MLTYVGPKGHSIEFDGPELDAIRAEPEEARAIVRKRNGKFAVAHYCYRRFGDGAGWGIWRDDEYKSQFEAMIALGLVEKLGKRWTFSDAIRRVDIFGCSNG